MDYRVKGVWLMLGGIGIGTIIGSGTAKRWGEDIGGILSSPNFSTLLAGLGGAALGGLISYVTARQTAKQTAAREKEASIIAERANAFSCMVTTMQIANGLFTMNKYLNEAANPPAGLQSWQILQAHASTSAEGVRYHPADFAPFINAGHADIVHRALLLSERYRSSEAAFSKYSDNRIKLEEFLLPHSSVTGGAMSSEIPAHLHATAHYLMDSLNKLIAQMDEFCRRDFEDAKVLLNDMNTAFSKRFGKHANFKLQIGDD